MTLTDRIIIGVTSLCTGVFLLAVINAAVHLPKVSATTVTILCLLFAGNAVSVGLAVRR